LILATAIRPRTASLSEIGFRRQKNEDRLLIRELAEGATLLAVADGMGGHAGGEIAAQLAIDTLAGMAPELNSQPHHLVRMIEKANQAVQAQADHQPELRGMGCTLTAALVGNGRIFWSHVGDSRLYLFRGGELRQLTTDQNMAQHLVETGRLTPEEARNSPFRHLLAQCVGCGFCRPASGSLQGEKSDLLLLATDGLYGELPTHRIAAILKEVEEPDRIVQLLVRAALDSGGHDNITAIVAALLF
jgi:PPM family protein phosphatase